MVGVEQATYSLGAAGLAVGVVVWAQLMRTRSAGGKFGWLLVIPGFATLAYALMAMRLTTVTVGGVAVPVVRYVDWLVTTVVLIGYVAHVAGAPRRVTAAVVAVDAVMILVGFAGVMMPGAPRAAAFAVSSLCYVVLLVALYRTLPTYAREQSAERIQLFQVLQNHVGLLWLGYPVVWAAGPLGLGAVSTLAVVLTITFMDVMAKTPYVYFVYRHRDAFPGVGGENPSDDGVRREGATPTPADD